MRKGSVLLEILYWERSEIIHIKGMKFFFGMLSEVEMAARGRLRCLGPAEILRGRLRFS